MASPPLSTVSPRARAGVRDEGQRGPPAGRQRRTNELHEGAQPLIDAGGWRARGLTFLILLLLLLSASSEQGKDDACLGVHTHSCHHHSSRAFHDMSAWRSQHRDRHRDLRCRVGGARRPQVLSQGSQRQGLRVWRLLEAVLTLSLDQSLVPGLEQLLPQGRGVSRSQSHLGPPASLSRWTLHLPLG